MKRGQRPAGGERGKELSLSLSPEHEVQTSTENILALKDLRDTVSTGNSDYSKGKGTSHVLEINWTQN